MKRLGSTAALLAILSLGPLAGCGAMGGDGNAAAVDDATITAGVKAAIGRSAELGAADIDVRTHRGVVWLTGFVSSADRVATAASAARTVKGVRSVRNEIRLK